MRIYSLLDADVRWDSTVECVALASISSIVSVGDYVFYIFPSMCTTYYEIKECIGRHLYRIKRIDTVGDQDMCDIPQGYTLKDPLITSCGNLGEIVHIGGMYEAITMYVCREPHMFCSWKIPCQDCGFRIRCKFQDRRLL